MVGKVLLILGIIAVALSHGAAWKPKLNHKRLNLEGGTNAQEGQFPYQASVQFCFFGLCEHVCGGVIINETWVLTSAGCVGDASKVVVGSIDLHAANLQSIEVSKKIVHENYPDNGIGPNDIALLKLKEPITFNDNVQAAQLPEQGQEINGTATVSGYGYSLLPDFNKLQYVDSLQIISVDECKEAVQRLIPDQTIPLDDDSNLCTLNESSNNCDGDLGGPLTQNGTVVGTVTWFIDPCGTNGAPNVFTNIANFVDWINEAVANN